MQRTPRAGKRPSGQPTEHRRVVIGLALLFAVFFESSCMPDFGTVSTTITANNDPSALQQFATFAKLQEVADEEDLDWGSLTRLTRSGGGGHRGPRAMGGEETPTVASLWRRLLGRSPSSSSSSSGQSRHGSSSDDDSDTNANDADGGVSTAHSGSGASTDASRRRRPHRRQHRKKSGPSPGNALSSGCSEHSDGGYGGASSVTSSVATTVHDHPIWSQFHVMEVAYSTRSNNFIHVTQRFVEYQRMYATVYRCAVEKVSCPHEAELLSTQATGVAASRHWACDRCGRKHNAVRERCQRCRSPSRFAKLFVGQAVKEVSCAPSLVQLLRATHPEVTLHRIECHHSDTSGGSGGGGGGRGRGCASLYVDRVDAAGLIAKLDRNVFFDIDDATGELIAHYVYTEQRDWLAAFAGERSNGSPGGGGEEEGPLSASSGSYSSSGSASGGGGGGASWLSTSRPSFLPRGPLVVEESRAETPPHHQQQQQQQQQPAGVRGTRRVPQQMEQSALAPMMTFAI